MPLDFAGVSFLIGSSTLTTLIKGLTEVVWFPLS